MPEFRLPIRIWSLNSNASTHRRARPRDLGSLNLAFKSLALLGWLESTSLAFKIIKVSTSNINCRLLDPAHFLLPLLGSRFPLEVAIGVNGRVWLKTPEVRQTIAVARCIEVVDEQGLDQTATVKFLNTTEL